MKDDLYIFHLLKHNKFKSLMNVITRLGHTFLLVTEFKLSQWLISNVNSILELLHLLILDNVANISEVSVESIFRIECRLMNGCM
jgi:hypothetical protein